MDDSNLSNQNSVNFLDMAKPILSKWIVVPKDKELLSQAKNEPIRFMRDTVSLPTASSYPFFTSMDIIHAAIRDGLINPFHEQERAFDKDYRCHYSDTEARYIHVDLAKKKDAAVFTMAHCRGFTEVEEKGLKVNKPLIEIDCVARFTKPEKGDIDIEQVLDNIRYLSEIGFYIRLITFDSYNSLQPIQDLRKDGFTCAVLSIDNTTYVPVVDSDGEFNIKHKSTQKDISYCCHALKSTFVEGRMYMFYSAQFLHECQYVEDDPVTRKVSTPTKYPDDVFQTIAGVTGLIHINETYATIPDDNTVDLDPDRVLHEKQFNSDLNNNYGIDSIDGKDESDRW